MAPRLRLCLPWPAAKVTAAVAAAALAAAVATTVAALLGGMAAAAAVTTASGVDSPLFTPPPPHSSVARRATPPMGVNTWNTFRCAVNESLVRRLADAMATRGSPTLREAGYEYLIIDDCWQGDRDAATGDISANVSRFPSGMAAVASYVHGRGLRFGLYSDVGAHTCAGRPGALGHEARDAATYAKWGVDYLKV